MGIDINAINRLLDLKKNNLNLDSIATIGRQDLCVKEPILNKILKNFDFHPTLVDFISIYENKYVDNLLKFLGFERVDSFDYSGYEQASVVHDMNAPVPGDYKNKYSIVLDCGTLEHVFNFPCAIKNCMEMVKNDGFFISVTVCNNFSGHGFYQFSPELFFRIFSSNNGFAVREMYIDDNKNKYSIIDPEIIGSRVTFKNNRETYLVVVAQKIEQKNIFEILPLQSDYVPMWRTNNSLVT